ncbi:hypothetical protein D8Y20_07450 [Mariprofundus sp. EBB-1]|uniref:pseudouridine synthase n=1 Tax=Mariprofundus sp. EBB-1 TaxID=2650971 RepID=UPI000EF1F157|nr:pseudouridine synthase [Mariprofundus sp. EBB-1]RLL52232.1 hypothetical protein D8Y20_07450 [Mariprofundus sp. EBB-1]
MGSLTEYVLQSETVALDILYQDEWLVAINKPAQEMVTVYRILARVELPYPVGRYQSERYVLLSVTPETGRKHQIRRHLRYN